MSECSCAPRRGRAYQIVPLQHWYRWSHRAAYRDVKSLVLGEDETAFIERRRFGRYRVVVQMRVPLAPSQGPAG